MCEWRLESRLVSVASDARFEGVRIVDGPNYTAERGEILVTG